jgi:hypothetical protein
VPGDNSVSQVTIRWAPEARRALLLVMVAAVAFRLPALVNARGVHSDAAIVGLQAMHLLRGEGSWFIWGAGYQASFDALLIALAFALTGPSALALMAVPLAGHLLLTFFAFDCLRRRLPVSAAAVAALALAFTPQAISGVALYAPRQWCLTFLVAGVWLLDGASAGGKPLVRYAAGACVGVLSLYLDLFSLQLMPALAVLALGACLDGRPKGAELARRIAAAAAGTALALFVLWLSRQSPVANATKATLAFERWRGNLGLLWDTCLPWILGYGVYVPGKNLYPDRWTPPALFHAVQVLGAASLMAGIAFGGAAALWRRIPWEVRRLGLFGFVATASALGGFLVSSMPADMWSARYLAPIVWTAPFALAPVAYVLGPRRFGWGLSVYLAVAAVGGWVSYGPYVRGPLPMLDPRGQAHDEDELAAALRQRGVKYAAAQYWLSYRLTFLFREDPVVIPLADWEDRYPPYRGAFAAAPVVAYLFHPSEPRATPEPYEAELRRAGAKYERIEVRGFTVLIHERRR